jgi:hypothetical protein
MVTKSIPPLEKIVSRSRKMRNIRNSSSSLQTTVIQANAAKNGIGVVYHRSDCSYPGTSFYINGGDANGSVCGYWQDALIPHTYDCPYTFTRADVVWYGVYNNDDETYKNLIIKDLNKGGGHNWTDAEITNITYRATIYCED